MVVRNIILYRYSSPQLLVLAALVGSILVVVVQLYASNSVYSFHHPSSSSSSSSSNSNSSAEKNWLLELFPFRSNKIPQRLGGFCPDPSCPFGKTRIREAWRQDPNASARVQANPANQWASVTIPWRSNNNSSNNNSNNSSERYEMMTRDPIRDQYISAVIQRGQEFDPTVRSLVRRCLANKSRPIFVDVGANIGYFTSTALSLGAQTISFEPYWENMGSLMATIERNGWKDRASLYMNAVSNQASRIQMEPTSDNSNLSNMYISGITCALNLTEEDPNLQYGKDYMEAVSIDQVMLTRHADIVRVDLMKVDVETHEMQVLDGAMRFLCNAIVERIVLEVEYLKPKHNLTLCHFHRLQNAIVKMGYQIFDTQEQTEYTGKNLSSFPIDVVFVLTDASQSPAKRLRNSPAAAAAAEGDDNNNNNNNNNPCSPFSLQGRSD